MLTQKRAADVYRWPSSLDPCITIYPLKLARESREIAIDTLARSVDVVEALLGTQLPRDDPERAFDAYSDEMRKLFEVRALREACVADSEAETCIYSYGKFVGPANFLSKPILAACRGLVVEWFRGGGYRLAALPFPKFFNLGEVPQTRTPPPKGFVATEKLDGTLVIVWRDRFGELRTATRSLLDRHTPRREPASSIANPYSLAFIRAIRRMGIAEEIESLVGDGATAMFELVGRVPASRAAAEGETIDPGDPSWKPYLLALRPPRGPVTYVEMGIPSAPRVGVETVEEATELVRRWSDREGIVLHYPGMLYDPRFPWWDYLVKLKSPRYLMIVSGSVSPKAIAVAVARGTIDDLVLLLPSPLRSFSEEVRKLLEELAPLWEEASRRPDVVERMKRVQRGEARRIAPYIERGASGIALYIEQQLPRSRRGIIAGLESAIRALKRFLRLGSAF